MYFIITKNYLQIQIEKLYSYPPGRVVTETYSDTPLQSLLDHTTSRLLRTLDLSTFGTHLRAYYKYGFDGCNLSIWRQKRTDKTTNFTQLFVSAVVPLRIKNVVEGTWGWVNDRSSSVLYCRIKKFMYQKESAELITKEAAELEKEIKALKPLEIDGLLIEYHLCLTMLDGKVL